MIDNPETPVVDSNPNTAATLALTTESKPDFEAKARELGWRGKEEFKGNPAEWVEAEAYYEKGQHVLPIVKSQLKSEKALTAKLAQEIAVIKQDALRVKEFVERQASREQGELKAEIAALKQAKITAIQDGDGAKVVEIDERLDQVKIAQQAADKPIAPATPAPVAPDPAFEEWVSNNKWYKSKPALTGWANARAFELEAGGKSLDDVLEIVGREVRQLFPDQFGDKSLERPSAQRGGGTSKPAAANSYEAMPAEDRQTCDRMVKAYGFKKEDYVKNYWSE